MKRKIQIKNNQIVLCDYRGKFILDPKEYYLSQNKAITLYSDNIPCISIMLFIQKNINDININLKKINGDLINTCGLYLCREMKDYKNVYTINMITGYIHAISRTSNFKVRLIYS